jgi:excisionase family DNA binding protein
VSALVAALLAELDDDALDVLAKRLAPRLAAQAEPKTDRWLTVEDAAAYLGCAKQRIYNLVSQRRLRHVKDGSRVLFRRQWLDEHLEAST